MRHGEREDEHAAPPASRLSELLECEQELAELMAVARVDARRVIDEARREAERAEAELEASLEKVAERVRREIGEASQGRVREVLHGAHERAARFERLSDEEVDALAGTALEQLLAAEEPP